MDGGTPSSAVYSLNVPVPGEAKRLAADLFPRLAAFDRVRKRHTLVAKRFEDATRGDGTERTRSHGSSGNHELATLRERVRPALVGTPAFEARIAGIEVFEQPVRGPGPVLYLAVESPGLHRLHRRLVSEFGAVPELEGEAYTPHVTLARGGSVDAARRLVDDVEPIEWVVSELHFFDPRYRETVGRVSLPA